MSINWPTVTLGDIATAQYGLSVAASDDGMTPILGMKHLQEGRVVFDGMSRVYLSTDEIDEYSVHPGDLLFNRTNSFDLVGKCSLVDTPTVEPTVFASYLVRLGVDRARADPAYVNYVLNAPASEKRLKDMATPGVSQFNINPTSLRKQFSFPLPPLVEQRRITAVLATWDRGIRQLTDLIAAKLRFKQGLMQQLLTGQRRFPGFVKNQGSQASPAGVVPADWTLRHLSDVTAEVRRRNDTGVTRVLTASGNHGLVDQQDYFNRSVAGKSLDGYFLLRRGEFAYNRSLMKGYPYGATKRLDDYEEGVVSTLYLCFRITSDECNSNWLTHVFEAGVLNSQLRGIAKMGARAHGLLNVAASEFFHIVLPMPSPEEQAAIASVLDTADAEIALLEKELDALKQQKKGLMQKLLTGRVRVPVPKGVT